MIPKSRFSCPGLWAVIYGSDYAFASDNYIRAVVNVYWSDRRQEFCFLYHLEETGESSLSNLTCWCLVDHTGYEPTDA